MRGGASSQISLIFLIKFYLIFIKTCIKNLTLLQLLLLVFAEFFLKNLILGRFAANFRSKFAPNSKKIVPHAKVIFERRKKSCLWYLMVTKGGSFDFFIYFFKKSNFERLGCQF